MNGRKIFLGALAAVFLSTAPALPAKAAEPASQTTADTAPAPTVNQGGCKINGRVYVFDEQGKILRNKKNRMVTVCGKIYYIKNSAGNPATGYFVYKNNL